MTRPEWPAYLLSALALIGIAVLAGLSVHIPDVLNYVAVGGLTGGAGITLGGSSSSQPPAPPAPPATLPPFVAQAPPPGP